MICQKAYRGTVSKLLAKIGPLNHGEFLREAEERRERALDKKFFFS